MTRRSALRCWVVAAAVAGLASGCTSSGGTEPPSDVVTFPDTSTSVSSTPPATPASTTAEASTPAESTTSSTVSSRTAPESTPDGSSPSTSGPHTTCTQLSVRVIPGGATFGEQIAGLQFTNEGTTRCVVAGYPTVTLLLDGRVIGQPSSPSTGERSLRRLRPGEVAESLLHDYTQTCQAPLSDSVRVQVPGSGQTVIRPGMQLRACVLRVDKLGPPD